MLSFPNFLSFCSPFQTNFIPNLGCFSLKDRKWIPTNSTILHFCPVSATTNRQGTDLLKAKPNLGFLFSLEDFFTPALLMVGDLILGPSDASFRRKTSTAHDEFFFKVTDLLLTWTSADVIHHQQSLARQNLSSMEMLCSHPYLISRRTPNFSRSTKGNLVFSLVGLDPIIGPLTTSKPQPKLLQSRSISFPFLLSPSLDITCFYNPRGRRLLCGTGSIILLGLCKISLRSLVLALSVANNYFLILLESLGILVLNSNCQKVDYGFAISHSASILARGFSHHPIVKTSTGSVSSPSPSCTNPQQPTSCMKLRYEPIIVGVLLATTFVWTS